MPCFLIFPRDFPLQRRRLARFMLRRDDRPLLAALLSFQLSRESRSLANPQFEGRVLIYVLCIPRNTREAKWNLFPVLLEDRIHQADETRARHRAHEFLEPVAVHAVVPTHLRVQLSDRLAIHPQCMHGSTRHSLFLDRGLAEPLGHAAFRRAEIADAAGLLT